MYPKVYIKDSLDFYSKKQLLDGCIFWRSGIGNKVCIMIMLNYWVTHNHKVSDIVKKLLD